MSETKTRRRRSQEKRVGAIARWFLPSLGSFCVLLILYLLIFSSWRFLLDTDTGWHIRAGELVLETGGAPRVDPFSHSLPGREWFAWEWLTDVAMALLHKWRGLAGVVCGAILTLLLSYAALYQLMMRRGADPLIACVLTVFAALAGIVHWLARPHLVSIALMIVWYALVESLRRNRTKHIYFVPLLVALWANLHGAFAATFAVLAVYAIGEWLEFALRREWWSEQLRRVLATYAIVGALSAVAAAATPYGLRLYGHLWRYLTDKELLASIQEFQSPNFHLTDGKLIEVLLLLGAVAAVNALRQGRVVETGLLVLWGHMTLQSERHVTLAVVMLAPIIAEQLTNLAAEMIERIAQGSDTPAKVFYAMRDWYRATLGINRQLTGAFVYVCVLVFLFTLTASRWADKALSPQFNPKRLPVAAADYVLRTQPSGNLYSSDHYGGYLIYRLAPQFKVFVDGRSDFYRQGAVLDDYDTISSVKPGWDALLDKYRIDWMVLKRDEPLALIAQMSGRWESVFEDGPARILIRKNSTSQYRER
jgi:hypothetical protein